MQNSNLKTPRRANNKKYLPPNLLYFKGIAILDVHYSDEHINNNNSLLE